MFDYDVHEYQAKEFAVWQVIQHPGAIFFYVKHIILKTDYIQKAFLVDKIQIGQNIFLALC